MTWEHYRTNNWNIVVKMGRYGWELVSVTTENSASVHSFAPDTFYYLKRQITEPATDTGKHEHNT